MSAGDEQASRWRAAVEVAEADQALAPRRTRQATKAAVAEQPDQRRARRRTASGSIPAS